MRLSAQDISRLLPPKLLGTSWEAVQQFARAVEAETAERCAQLCATFDVCDPKHIADAIRAAYKEPTNE